MTPNAKMANVYENFPVFSKDWLWTRKDLKSLPKEKREVTREPYIKAEVSIYGGK